MTGRRLRLIGGPRRAGTHAKRRPSIGRRQTDSPMVFEEDDQRPAIGFLLLRSFLRTSLARLSSRQIDSRLKSSLPSSRTRCGLWLRETAANKRRAIVAWRRARRCGRRVMRRRAACSFLSLSLAAFGTVREAIPHCCWRDEKPIDCQSN